MTSPPPHLEDAVGPQASADKLGAHLSTLRLHQLRYGELDRTQAADARRHLDRCTQCRERHQGQQAFRVAFVLRPPELDLAGAGAATVPSLWSRVQRWRRWTPVPVLVMAAALLTVRFLPPTALLGVDAVDSDHGATVAETTHLKGEAEIVVLIEGRGALAADDLVFAGDTLQLRIPAGPWTEAWVGDGRSVLGHFPLSSDGPTLSPFALTVDGQPGMDPQADEELIVLLSTDPLSQDGAKAALAGRRMNGVVLRRLALHKGSGARTDH